MKSEQFSIYKKILSYCIKFNIPEYMYVPFEYVIDVSFDNKIVFQIETKDYNILYYLHEITKGSNRMDIFSAEYHHISNNSYGRNEDKPTVYRKEYSYDNDILCDIIITKEYYKNGFKTRDGFKPAHIHTVINPIRFKNLDVTSSLFHLEEESFESEDKNFYYFYKTQLMDYYNEIGHRLTDENFKIMKRKYILNNIKYCDKTVES